MLEELLPHFRLSFNLISLVFSATLAHADYHYASHTGTNTYPYTNWETAADSITSAMNAASPYDTIYIAAGEYNEVMNMGAQDSCKTFIGAGTDSTHCFTDVLSEIWNVANRTVAEGLWFTQTFPRFCISARAFGLSVIVRNCKFTGSIGIFAGGDSLVAENCQFIDEEGAIDASFGVRKLVFRNNYFKTTQTPSVFLVRYSKAVIENNIFLFEHLTPNGEFFADPGPADTLIFINNYVDNFTYGVDFVGTRLGVGLNNTIRRNGRWTGYYAYSATDYNDSVNIVLENNAATESSRGIWAIHFNNYVHHLSAHYNGFWDNTYGDITTSNWSWDDIDTIGNIHAYPMYANPDSFDVHLQAHSPFIDAGDPLILDMDGTRSDIGVFGGPGGSSYQYRDLPPRKPDSLAYSISGDSLIIRWRANHEADFWRYIINRDTISGFTPWAGNIVAEPGLNIFSDFNWNRFHNYYYRIAAYDNQGNLSPYSVELRVINVGIEDNSGVEVPSITAIESNYPNPFNSSTTIIYSVANLGPIPAQINIDIYDIQGRKVRTLINNREEMGRHTVIWDGRDDSGNELASGIYFARIMQWDVDYLSKSQKLVLVR
jgi:hypothetical protein